jgi:hypothetical protein
MTTEIDFLNGYIITGSLDGQIILWDRNSGSIDSIIKKPILPGLPI